MTRIALTTADARRELGGTVDAGDDGDLVGAYARAIWSALVEPGDRVAGALVAALGAAQALEFVLSLPPDRVGGAATAAASVEVAAAADLTVAELAQGCGRWHPRLGSVGATLATARREGVQLITPEDAAWPRRADDLGPFAPLCLWVRGDPTHLAAPAGAVAIVGARAASAYGEHVARDLAAASADAGFAVCSGAAYGIDAAAHRAALSVGGLTIAVMAGGVDRPYPAGNRELIERIGKAGAVIAEVACGTAPTKHRFLARNRLIAALSDATVVVEAGWRSGSLNTAHHAQALGRPVGVVPGPITSASSMGCHRLLREGDAICVTGAADVFELLGEQRAIAVGSDEARTGEDTRVLDALSVRSPRGVEDIARRAGFAVDEAAALLGLLALDGRAERRAAGWVQAAQRVQVAQTTQTERPGRGGGSAGPAGPAGAAGPAATLW